MMPFTNVRTEFIDNSWKSENSSSLLPPDMECVCVWLVCVCILRMCVEAHSSLDKGDHDNLDHQHHHLVSDGNAASGKTHSGYARVFVLLFLVVQCHLLFGLRAHEQALT